MYKGFTIINEKADACCKGKAVWLRHDRTGLQIVHFKTEEKKKFFSFNFKTPLSNDMGIPHVLEHMIFTGSQKYHVKDLLDAVRKFGACEYCNGLTCFFYTSYPVETYITKDFYNMLDLYGDAVFFPLLRKESFLQEGWHFELDENDKPYLNGVVYNEISDMDHRNMYSVYDQRKVLMQNSDLRFCPGGKSFEIPKMTYEMVVDYYKKYYVPANCVLFIYNHLDLEEQLEFLEEQLLSRLPSGTEEAHVNDDIIPLKDLSTIKARGAYNGNKRVSVGLSFMFKAKEFEHNVERDYFLSLIQDEFAEELSRNPVGLDGSFEEGGSSKNRFMTFYVDGVPRSKVGKAKKYLLDFVQHMYEHGIQEKTVTNVRITTDHTFSMEVEEFDASSIGEDVVSGWAERKNPLLYIGSKDKWDFIRPKFMNYSEEYFKSLIKNFFVENRNRTFILTIPDKKYYEKIDRKVQRVSKKIASKTTKEQIQKSLEELRKYQAEEDDYSNFKEVTVKDLPKIIDVSYAEKEMVPGKSGDILLFSSVQKVSNYSWFTVRFPADTLEYEDYKYLSDCINFINSIGLNDLSYADSSDFVDVNSLRDLDRSLNCLDNAYYCKKEQIYENRQWINMSCIITNSDLEKGLKAFSDFIFKPNFNNAEDIKVLKEKMLVSLSNEVEVAGNNWDAFDAYSHFGKIAKIMNDIKGINSAAIQREFAKEGVDSIFTRYQQIYQKILSSGAILGVVANEEQMPAAKEAIKKFILDNEIKPLAVETTCFPEVEDKPGVVENTIISQVDAGSACLAYRGPKYKTKEFAAAMSLMAWFSDTVLQDFVRRQNGAYSVSCWLDGFDSLVTFCTARDPNPKRSIELFLQCLKELENTEFDDDTVMKIIKSNYVEGIKHKSSYEKGRCAIERHLSGMKPEYRNQRIKYLLELTAEDFHNAAICLNQMAKDYKSCIITGDDSQIMGKVLWDYRK